MAIDINDYISKLPKDRQDRIALRSKELIDEEYSLSELRKTLMQTQKEVGCQLNINQAAVSKLERRTDMYISTLRNYIEAMGGKLDLVARFPNDVSVNINQF